MQVLVATGAFAVGLDSAEVIAVGGIDLDHVALLDEERHLDRQPGLDHGLLGEIGNRIPFDQFCTVNACSGNKGN